MAALSRGDFVDVELRPGVWRRGWLSRHAPYPKANCDGWDVIWHPLPRVDPLTGVMPSTSGWHPARLMRPAILFVWGPR